MAVRQCCLNGAILLCIFVALCNRCGVSTRRRTKLERAAYIRMLKWEPMRQETPVQAIGGCRANNIIEWSSIMKRVTKIAIGAVTVLTLGLTTVVVTAHAHGYGPGMGMGMGPGYGPGYGPGAGMGGG